ncbi:MAG: tRNA (adenosine(37)-N6)-dimethylallyltransferase MiaA [Candidatus Pacebacteria bacterium]|nr:tRNA (adenosine(37)-N6)-dimethylallyltransferase MiaA [Candidatus Paceibacterota bacterium]
MKSNLPRVIVIAGPTASGKSDIAISIAQKLNGEIISADSRQVYRGMDIGTGKVTKREQRLARHWLLNISSPKRSYNVSHFQRDAKKAIADILRRGKLPIICGGTGFWIDALVYGLELPEVKPNPALRKELVKLSPAELFQRLKTLDPVRAKSIDQKNPVRLIRALEIVLTTGKPVQKLARKHQSPYDTLYLCVSRPADQLRTRITKRLDARLRSGMIAEVKRLHASGVSWKRLEAFGLEYRWVAQHLQGKLSRTCMRDGLLRDIIAYSKRQLTWWKRNKDIRWISSINQAKGLVYGCKEHGQVRPND